MSAKSTFFHMLFSPFPSPPRAHMGPTGPIWGRMGPYGVHMGPIGPIWGAWAYMGPHGPIWGPMGSMGQGRWAKADGPGPMGLKDPPVGVYFRARGRWGPMGSMGLGDPPMGVS